MVPLTISIVGIFAAATLVVSRSAIYGRVRLDPDEEEEEGELFDTSCTS